MNIFSGVLSFLSEPVTQYLKNKSRKEELQSAIDQKQLELVSQAESYEHLWEIEQIRSGFHSWKDEYVTLVISIPAILSFVCPTTVLSGFKALEASPEWYQYTFLSVMLAAVGINMTSKLKNKLKRFK